MNIKTGFYQGCVLFLLFITGCSSNAQDVSTQQALEKQFQESMSGVILDGFFKTNDAGNELRKEKYSITKVSKLAGEYWIFQARIQYGDRDVTLPIPVTIKWAGDTPVLTLTDATIPGLGTFTTRVLFYGGQYVGVWRHGEHTGQHFGRIIPQDSLGKE
ncbi:hypothetical protein MYX78_10345 [Acidobacteria bacterium AH-259-G07]|nr:hypothetical protein [Acidobacteria bacterium AH-259-G07]